MTGISKTSFGGTFPFKEHYFDAGNFMMHYVDEGKGEPVLLLHGDPTWGYLWRRFIPALSGERRVIVPDHMGMGKSQAPESPYPYVLRHHIDNLEALVLHLGLEKITLIVHDWGGPVGLGFAIRHAGLIKRLVLTNTWGFARWPGGEFPRLLEIIRSPRGESFVLDRNGHVNRALKGTVNYPEKLTPETMAAYLAPFPTPESRRALLCWSRDIPVEEGDQSWKEMERIEKNLHLFKHIPILIFWGMLYPVLPPSVLDMWKEIYPSAIIREIADASHFLQEDSPDAVIKEIKEFLNNTDV